MTSTLVFASLCLAMTVSPYVVGRIALGWNNDVACIEGWSFGLMVIVGSSLMLVPAAVFALSFA